MGPIFTMYICRFSFCWSHLRVVIVYVLPWIWASWWACKFICTECVGVVNVNVWSMCPVPMFWMHHNDASPDCCICLNRVSIITRNECVLVINFPLVMFPESFEACAFLWIGPWGECILLFVTRMVNISYFRTSRGAWVYVGNVSRLYLPLAVNVSV
jgi:hypothetical protein